MFIQSSVATPRSQKARTGQPTAWKNNYYETYRINFPIPAARLHENAVKGWGHWFAVDTYDLSIAKYHNDLALVDKKGKATRLKSPVLDLFLLFPGTIVNVGLARSQGYHSGGGWQFEIVDGPSPSLIEQIHKPQRIKL